MRLVQLLFNTSVSKSLPGWRLRRVVYAIDLNKKEIGQKICFCYWTFFTATTTTIITIIVVVVTIICHPFEFSEKMLPLITSLLKNT